MSAEHHDPELAQFRAAVAEGNWQQAAAVLQGLSSVIVPMVELRLGSLLRGDRSAEDLFASSVAGLCSRLVEGRLGPGPERSLRAWLFTVVLRQGIDSVRGSARSRKREKAAARSETETSPAADVGLRQRERLRAVLDLLSSPRVGLGEKEVLILRSDLARHFEVEAETGGDDEKLAAALGVSKQRLWNLRCRARRRLAVHLPEVLDHG